MKLHITVNDLAELSEEELKKHHYAFYPPYFMLQTIDKRIIEKQDKKVRKIEISDDGRLYIYRVDTGEFYALPSIGQMIEYLKDRQETMPVVSDSYCDDLWRDVRETYK